MAKKQNDLFGQDGFEDVNKKSNDAKSTSSSSIQSNKTKWKRTRSNKNTNNTIQQKAVPKDVKRTNVDPTQEDIVDGDFKEVHKKGKKIAGLTAAAVVVVGGGVAIHAMNSSNQSASEAKNGQTVSTNADEKGSRGGSLFSHKRTQHKLDKDDKKDSQSDKKDKKSPNKSLFNIASAMMGANEIQARQNENARSTATALTKENNDDGVSFVKNAKDESSSKKSDDKKTGTNISSDNIVVNDNAQKGSANNNTSTNVNPPKSVTDTPVDTPVNTPSKSDKGSTSETDKTSPVTPVNPVNPTIPDKGNQTGGNTTGSDTSTNIPVTPVNPTTPDKGGNTSTGGDNTGGNQGGQTINPDTNKPAESIQNEAVKEFVKAGDSLNEATKKVSDLATQAKTDSTNFQNANLTFINLAKAYLSDKDKDTSKLDEIEKAYKDAIKANDSTIDSMKALENAIKDANESDDNVKKAQDSIPDAKDLNRTEIKAVADTKQNVSNDESSLKDTLNDMEELQVSNEANFQVLQKYAQDLGLNNSDSNENNSANDNSNNDQQNNISNNNETNVAENASNAQKVAENNTKNVNSSVNDSSDIKFDNGDAVSENSFNNQTNNVQETNHVTPQNNMSDANNVQQTDQSDKIQLITPTPAGTVSNSAMS